jgi:hypothetical protein
MLNFIELQNGMSYLCASLLNRLKYWINVTVLYQKEKIEDTKGISGSRKSKKDRQCIG